MIFKKNIDYEQGETGYGQYVIIDEQYTNYYNKTFEIINYNNISTYGNDISTYGNDISTDDNNIIINIINILSYYITLFVNIY